MGLLRWEHGKRRVPAWQQGLGKTYVGRDVRVSAWACPIIVQPKHARQVWRLCGAECPQKADTKAARVMVGAQARTEWPGARPSRQLDG